MRKLIFTDKSGEELIVKHRKSAIFFEMEVDVDKPNKYGPDHADYICITELDRVFNFEKEEFERFVAYCQAIATESWATFEPKAADSLGAEYDDYYDKEFDNNGRLSIRAGLLSVSAPYTQLKSNGAIVRLIKFNKRKFESFVYDLEKILNKKAG